MEASTIGFIVYLTITVLLVILLSVHAYSISEWKSTTSFFKAVLGMKSIYGTVLVHLYDTSTDIAILISWGILTANEVSGNKNHENVNMLTFLIPSILLIFVYRIAYAMIHYNIFKSTTYYSRTDMILILLDLYIFVLVYTQFSERYISPCMMQRKLQLLESVFESMPQLVMQSIFVIRTYNTKLAESDSIYIVFASIVASLVSIVTKFSNDDKEWVSEQASSAHWTHKRFPCVSISYLFVILWRLCESIARFSIFTLLWAVLGGIYLPIYLLISIIFYYGLEQYTDLVWITITKYSKNKNGSKKKIKLSVVFIWLLQSVVGFPLRYRMTMNVIRVFDNCIVLAIIYSFAFVKFDCILCYDESERNAFYNPYIFILLIMAGIATCLQFVIYLGLYFMQILSEESTFLPPGIIGMAEIKTANDIKMAGAHPLLLKAVKWKYELNNVSKNSDAQMHDSDDTKRMGSLMRNATVMKLYSIYDENEASDDNDVINTKNMGAMIRNATLIECNDDNDKKYQIGADKEQHSPSQPKDTLTNKISTNDQ